MEHKISTEVILGLSETSKEAKSMLKELYPLLFIDVGFYYINNTMKVLYWNGTEWQGAVKDSLKMYTLITQLERQPKNIKTVERYRTMFD